MSNFPNHDSPSSVAIINVQDLIYAKVQKSQAVLTCIMFAAQFVRGEMELDNNTLYHALWAVDDYLEELGLLFEQLKKLVPAQ